MSELAKQQHSKDKIPLPPQNLMEGAVLLSQGAEARVYRSKIDGKSVIVKERFSKKYRHEELDRRITHLRLRIEARNMGRANALGIRVPKVIASDKKTGRLVIEDLGEKTVKSILWNEEQQQKGTTLKYSQKAKEICAELGRIVGKLHSADICHGDLTTSNFMCLNFDETAATMTSTTPPPALLAPIDFGLSFISASLEDKAVDLYVLERAFLCTHRESSELVQIALNAYINTYSTKGEQVLRRLEQVRTRGRKKVAFG